MTLVQMQPRSACATPVHRTPTDAMDAAGPQVCDDMTTKVAVSVMDRTRNAHPLVRDDDGPYTAQVTQTLPVAVRDSSEHTDHVQPRDILGDCGPLTSPVTTTTGAGHAMRQLDAPPVVDEQGSARGVSALAR